MATHDSLFAHPSFLRYTCLLKEVSADARRTLPDYGIITAAALLFTLFFSYPQAFAATTQNQAPQKASLPLNWNCGTPKTGHCYGSNFWGTASGADTRISLNTLLSGGGTSNDLADQSFVTTEMWLTNGTDWVEAGIQSQYYITGNTFPYYFWADQRPNGGGFSSHYLASISYDSNALVRITRSGTSSWNVLIRDSLGDLTGTSTNNNITTKWIQLGSELYNNNRTAYIPKIDYTNNRWYNGNWNYQGNDGVGVQINSPVIAGWNQHPANSNTGGDWYSCIPGYGC